MKTTKTTLVNCLILGCFILVILAVSLMAADTRSVELRGTWSGSWTPQGGVPDALTVELQEEKAGNLTGRFLTPVPMFFTNASFSPKNATVVLEAVDEKSGRHYKLSGKVDGTRIKGNLAVDGQTGGVELVKWTYTYIPKFY